MPGLWIKNSLATDAKRKLREKYAYTFNAQYYGASTFFVIEKKRCKLIQEKDVQTSSISRKKWRCTISNMKSPKPTCRLRNVWMRYPSLGKPIQKLRGRNSPSTPPHHAQSSRTTWRPGGLSGRRTRISQQSRWGPWPWGSITTSSSKGGGPPRIPRMIRS